MTPAVPPLPTPWNLPFQVVAGSQTSILTAGDIVAVTRQNAGRLGSAALPGGVYEPAGMDWVPVTVVIGSINVASWSQVIGAAPAIAGIDRPAAAHRRQMDLCENNFFIGRTS